VEGVENAVLIAESSCSYCILAGNLLAKMKANIFELFLDELDN
jgi:hypothetical protein